MAVIVNGIARVGVIISAEEGMAQKSAISASYRKHKYTITTKCNDHAIETAKKTEKSAISGAFTQKTEIHGCSPE